MKSTQVIKTVFACLFLAWATSNLSAQDSPFSITANAGINASDMRIKDLDTDLKVNCNLNVGLEYNLSKNFFLQTGIEFSGKGAKIKDDESGLMMGKELLEHINDPDINPADEYLYGSMTRGKITNRYLTLPVMGGYRLNLSDKLRVNLALGCYFSYGVGGKTKMNQLLAYGTRIYTESNLLDTPTTKLSSFSLAINSSDLFKRFDMGLRGSVGVEYHRFLLTVGYEYGLTDLHKANMVSSHNMNLIATVGFRIF